MADGRLLGQIRRSVREHGHPGRRAGEHGAGGDEHADAPRHDLRTVGVQDQFCNPRESGGGEGGFAVGRRDIFGKFHLARSPGV